MRFAVKSAAISASSLLLFGLAAVNSAEASQMKTHGRESAVKAEESAVLVSPAALTAVAASVNTPVAAETKHESFLDVVNDAVTVVENAVEEAASEIEEAVVEDIVKPVEEAVASIVGEKKDTKQEEEKSVADASLELAAEMFKEAEKEYEASEYVRHHLAEVQERVADEEEALVDEAAVHDFGLAIPVGKTPMVDLKNLDVPFNLYAKCEFANPTTSGKDRIAYSMVKAAIQDGRIVFDGKKKPTIIVSSIGASGVSFAMVGAALGIRVLVAAPRDLGEEYSRRIRAYGAKVVRPAEGKSYKNLAAYLNKKNPKWVVIDHTFDPASGSTGASDLVSEIESDLESLKVVPDMVVVGVVSGGTLSATLEISQQYPGVKVVAVALSDLSNHDNGDYFQTLNVHKWVTVSEKHAKKAANMLAQREGLLAGINSGAILYAALSAAKDAGLGANNNVVVVLPDARQW